MKIILLFTMLTHVSNVALGLDCYLCMGSASSDCNGRNNSSMMIQHCPIYQQSRNYCVSYTSFDSVQMSAGHVRGCGFMKKQDKRSVCEYLKELNLAESCEECKTDLCNI